PARTTARPIHLKDALPFSPVAPFVLDHPARKLDLEAHLLPVVPEAIQYIEGVIWHPIEPAPAGRVGRGHVAVLLRACAARILDGLQHVLAVDPARQPVG